LLGANQLEISLGEKDLGFLVVSEMDGCQPCGITSKKATSTLGFIITNLASTFRELVLPLY